MKEPVDQFAAYFRQLRTAKRWSATALSEQIGKSRTYLCLWERDANANPNRDALLAVADVLELAPAQRQRLFRLADLRGTPPAARSYCPSDDPDANLLQALLEIDHEWPDQPTSPDTQSPLTRALIDAAAWLLLHLELLDSYYVVVGLWVPLFERLRWPEPLTKLGLVLEARCDDPVDVPLDIIRQELPAVDRLRIPEAAAESEAFYRALGRALRRALFSDMTRAVELARRVAFWSYGRAPELQGVVRLYACVGSGESSAALKYGPYVDDVSAGVVADVNERTVAAYLRNAGRASLQHRGVRHVEWPSCFSPGPIERSALHTIALSQTTHYDTYGEAQSLRDAAYVFAHSHPSFRRIAQRAGLTEGSDSVLEEQLKRGRLDDALLQQVAVQPERLAAATEPALDMYVDRQLARVPSLEQDRVRERQRHALPSPDVPPDSAKPKAKKSTKAKANKTAKRKRKGK